MGGKPMVLGNIGNEWNWVKFFCLKLINTIEILEDIFPLFPFAPTVLNFWKTGCDFYHFSFGSVLKVVKGGK